MLNLILALLIGSIIGWLASLLMKTDAQQGTLLNIVIGVVGSVLGSWLFGDVLGIGGARSAGAFSLIGLLWAVLGACVLIFLLKLVRVLR
jgi:uncharacterized membrane protein YeaQ/YmgE (transglycosylase-associated protein family)